VTTATTAGGRARGVKARWAQNGNELAAEVIIQPAVEDRVGAGRTQNEQVTDGNDRRAMIGVDERHQPRLIEIGDDVVRIQRKPTSGEDYGDCDE